VTKEPPVPNLDWEPPAENAAFTVPEPPPSPRPQVVATSDGEPCPLLLLLEDGRVYRCSAGALQAGRIPDAEALHARFLGLLSAPPLVDVVPSDVDSRSRAHPGTSTPPLTAYARPVPALEGEWTSAACSRSDHMSSQVHSVPPAF